MDAGRQLAGRLQHLSRENPVVLGLPRGGVPVAFEVAQSLGAPLDVIVVRKLGVPFHRELAFGAIGEGGVRVIHDDIVHRARVGQDDLEAVERRELAELERQVRWFRGDRPGVSIAGRTAIVVDDGIATGATASAACQVVRAQGAGRVVLATPVAPPDAVAALRREVDDLVCLSTPTVFFAVGEWYRDFSQTSDEEVIALLEQAAQARPGTNTGSGTGSGSGSGTGAEAGDDPAPSALPPNGEVEIPVRAGTVRLAGDLSVPQGAAGVVVFAHGSGSSRLSPRNRSVAEILNQAGLGTLLFDLLTPREALDRANVFDVETLADRLTEVTRWLRRAGLPIGYFGASTGAAAALWAAGAEDADIAAVVSRGGRPDLAGPRLGAVRAPTLLIVGGLDTTVLELNRRAQAQLRCENRLEVVPGATHLFEEPGTLRMVADLAANWFTRHLAPAR